MINILKEINIAWRLEGILEVKISEENETLIIKCLANFGSEKIKTIYVFFDVFYSVSHTRRLNYSEFTNKNKFDWSNIKLRYLFEKDPVKWNEVIFTHMKKYGVCPDPFIYTVSNSILIKKSGLTKKRQEKFNHFLFISDEFYLEVVAEGDIQWSEIDINL